jgi:hypothetical protein
VKPRKNSEKFRASRCNPSFRGFCNLAVSAVFFEAMKNPSLLSKNGRLFVLTPVLALALLSGCSKSEEQRTVDAAVKRYAFVKVGMTKQEVVAKLGEPASKQESRYKWETSTNSDFNASLEVAFDGEGRVKSVSRSRVGHD